MEMSGNGGGNDNERIYALMQQNIAAQQEATEAAMRKAEECTKAQQLAQVEIAASEKKIRAEIESKAEYVKLQQMETMTRAKMSESIESMRELVDSFHRQSHELALLREVLRIMTVHVVSFSGKEMSKQDKDTIERLFALAAKAVDHKADFHVGGSRTNIDAVNAKRDAVITERTEK